MKKNEIEAKMLNFQCWLQGSYNCLATSIALNNAFSKKKLTYPDKPFENEKKLSKTATKAQKKIAKIKDPDVRNQMEFNYWARL